MLARRLYQRPAPGPQTHMLLKVEVNGREWLADVGFGGLAFRAPIPFEVGREEEQFDEKFRITQHAEFGFVLEKFSSAEWNPLYCFSGAGTFPGDIEMANFFTSDYPESNFKKKLMCARVTENGQLSLSNLDFRETIGAKIQTRTLNSHADLMLSLRERFGLEVDDTVLFQELNGSN